MGEGRGVSGVSCQVFMCQVSGVELVVVSDVICWCICCRSAKLLMGLTWFRNW